jgi:hypothetical protein
MFPRHPTALRLCKRAAAYLGPAAAALTVSAIALTHQPGVIAGILWTDYLFR